MNKPKWASVLLNGLVFIIITACSSNPPHNQGAPSGTSGLGAGNPGSSSANGSSGNSLQARNIGSGTIPGSIHHNTMIAVNGDMARQISMMPGVKSAYAITTDSNIYIAVRLKDDYNPPSSPGQAAPTQVPNTADSTSRADITSGITGNSYDLKNDPGAAMTSSNDVPTALKQKIIATVRARSGSSLHHVFVSANPDYRTVLEKYTQTVKQGKSIAGAVDDFNILAQRIFPTTDGTGAYGGSTSSGAPGKAYGNSSGSLRGQPRNQR